ncbi:MAG: N-acetylgalactosamine-4-sulfatase, partial [Verrucomicrobia bacterium]|nr:N-acetylgalactosamine-4-sulfatase [Verrucomicrobiota bacterium]
MLMLSFVLGMLADLELLTAQGSQQPNLLVILADDLGYGELGMQGNHQIPT